MDRHGIHNARTKREADTAGAPPQPADVRFAAVRDLHLSQVTAIAASLRRRFPSDTAVNDIRRHLKRSRATLRLLRGALGDAEFRRENRILRDASRPLTAVRDAKILVDTLELLRRKSDGEKTRASGRQLMRALRRDKSDSVDTLELATLRTEAARLDEAVRRMRSLTSARQVDVKQALVHAYEQGRASFATAAADPSDEYLHEWRTQVKYFLNELDSVALLSGRRFLRWRKQGERLARHLGKDHDLAVLKQKMNQLATLPPFGANPESLKEWAARLAKRRLRHQRKALRLGAKLFAHKPKRAAKAIAKQLGPAAEAAS